MTVLVPDSSVEGLREFACDLCRRQEVGTSHVAGQWRKLSPSAKLMVDPGRGARCAIRDTGAPGEGRYHWTVTVFEEPDPVAAGRTGAWEGTLPGHTRLCRGRRAVQLREG